MGNNLKLQETTDLTKTLFDPSPFSLPAMSAVLCTFEEESSSGNFNAMLSSLVPSEWTNTQENAVNSSYTYSHRDQVGLPPLSSMFSSRSPVADLQPTMVQPASRDYENITTSTQSDLHEVDNLSHYDSHDAILTSSARENVTLPMSDSYFNAYHLEHSMKSGQNSGKNIFPTNKGKVVKKRGSHQREKGRAPNVNVAFQKLRTLIPTEPVDRRLSKVETLRLAVSYIHHLGQTLNAEGWVEQPCLASSGVGNENMSTPICTFCMRKKRK